MFRKPQYCVSLDPNLAQKVRLSGGKRHQFVKERPSSTPHALSLVVSHRPELSVEVSAPLINWFVHPIAW